jgi:hypothetical protein
MKIQDQRGDPLNEATLTVDATEIIDLLQGLADVVEGKREHLHFKQPGGPEFVVKLGTESDADDSLDRQMDWYIGPLVLFGAIFIIIGIVTVVGWALGLLS